MLWRIARAAAPVAQLVAPVIDPSTTSRKCTPAFLLPIDACRTSSSILGGGALVVTFGLTSSGAGAQSTAVANTVPPDRVDGSLAIGAMAK
jgi:hypothetical protein